MVLRVERQHHQLGGYDEHAGDDGNRTGMSSEERFGKLPLVGLPGFGLLDGGLSRCRHVVIVRVAAGAAEVVGRFISGPPPGARR